MRAHLTLSDYGQFIGVAGECLTVKDGITNKKLPLNCLVNHQLKHTLPCFHP